MIGRNEHEENVYRECWNKWGNLQYVMVIEELSETIKAITKFLRRNDRSNASGLIEELVDGELMFNQLRYILHFLYPSIYDIEYEKMRNYKLERLKKMLDIA